MTSIIKVNNLQNQCGANIISESANTITIGASGDTVVLAAGASQSGFGRSGSVNWDTTPKTTGFTAVSGNGYFCNTTSAAFTVTLPATPAAGDIVAIADYNGTAASNNITVGRNAKNINGSAADFTISRNYAAISFVYVDSTAGWRSVDTSDTSSVVNQFVAATGGTITTCGNYKIHTFTGPGTFTVTNTGPQSSTVDYLVVAGGGAGAGGVGGGGGAGGFRESVPAPAAWTASPLANPGGALPVSVQAYPITVGAGATKNVGPNSGRGPSGSNSVFSTITSAGGGGGGGDSPSPPSNPGGSGGSGGGGIRGTPATGGTGNSPPTSPSQGTNGEPGLPAPARGGGGGGAGAAGGTGTQTYGGSGVGTAINSSPTVGTPGPSPSLRYFAGGGGGGGDWPYTGQGANGGTVGGGGPSYQGPFNPNTPNEYAIDGTANTGGGGGGGSNSGTSSGGASGGSGIVVIRYKFQ